MHSEKVAIYGPEVSLETDHAGMILDFWPLNCDTIYVRSLSHLVYGILLRQFKQTNIFPWIL